MIASKFGSGDRVIYWKHSLADGKIVYRSGNFLRLAKRHPSGHQLAYVHLDGNKKPQYVPLVRLDLL